MKQQYTPYWEWEDWINGMWRKVSKEEEEALLTVAVEFAGDHIKYGNAMKEVVRAWPRTMLNSLSNPSINRRAFLGQCACAYKMNLPEYIVRSAWRKLTDKQRYLADKVAQETINQYERENTGLHPNVEEPMLF